MAGFLSLNTKLAASFGGNCRHCKVAGSNVGRAVSGPGLAGSQDTAFLPLSQDIRRIFDKNCRASGGRATLRCKNEGNGDVVGDESLTVLPALAPRKWLS